MPNNVRQEAVRRLENVQGIGCGTDRFNQALGTELEA